MQHYRSLDDIALQNSWLTIGVFDGVHRGHQEILSNLTADAHQNGAPAVVLTFWPHPAVVLGKRHDLKSLTTPEERAELLGAQGVDVVITQPFTPDFAALSAFDFMRRVSRHLSLRSLWIGYDFALGHNREGDLDRLTELGKRVWVQRAGHRSGQERWGRAVVQPDPSAHPLRRGVPGSRKPGSFLQPERSGRAR